MHNVDDGDPAKKTPEKLKKVKSVVARTTFMAACPKDIEFATLHECGCPTCRDGCSALDDLTALRERHHADGHGVAMPITPAQKLEAAPVRHSGVDVAGELTVCDNDVCEAVWLQKEQLVETVKEKRAKLAAHAAHARTVKAQRDQFEAQRERARSTKGVGVLLFDFSPYCARYSRVRNLSEAMQSVQALHIVVYYCGENGGTFMNFDIFANESNDHHFVRAAFVMLAKHPKFMELQLKEIALVSDGGVRRAAAVAASVHAHGSQSILR